MKTLVILLLITFCCCSNILVGQTISEEKQDTFFIELSLPSEYLEQERNVLIHLPEDYYTSKQKYHVLYIFDAQWETLVDMTINTVKYLREVQEIHPMIIVGVEQVDRRKEFTPKRIKTDKEWGGEAMKLHYFVEKELAPFIDENFKTAPYRIAFGHSLGGLFVVNALTENPNLFQAVLSASGAFYYDEEVILDKIQQLMARSENLNNNHLYFTNGNEGELDRKFLSDNQHLDSLLNHAETKGLNWQFDFLKGKNHSTTPIPTLFDGLMYVYNDWFLSDSTLHGIYGTKTIDPLPTVEKHFRDLSQRIGYQVLPTPNVLNGIGYEYLERKDFDKAVHTFDRAIAYYPNDPNLYDSKGEVLEEAGQLLQAESFYRLAIQKLEKVDLNERTKAYYDETFRGHLKRVGEKIKQKAK